MLFFFAPRQKNKKPFILMGIFGFPAAFKAQKSIWNAPELILGTVFAIWGLSEREIEVSSRQTN
jgi:hypothetical protein